MLLSVKSIQGNREYMEDKYIYIEDESNGTILSFICDGHGGDKTSTMTIKWLSPLLLNTMKKFNKNMTNIEISIIIRKTIMQWGSEIKQQKSGATLTGVIKYNNIVYVFNIGDSRTVMRLKNKSKIYFLRPQWSSTGRYDPSVIKTEHYNLNFFKTIDHDDTNKIEVARVKSAGGKITNNRLNGILSVTRALGDKDIGKGLSYVPDIYWTYVTNIRGPIVMYSDGIYEMQRYETDKNFRDEYLYEIATTKNAGELVKYAHENGSDDNLTVLVITLN